MMADQSTGEGWLLMVSDTRGLEIQKDDESSSKNKLESLLDKIASSGPGKSIEGLDSHFDKK